jgi:transcriptional regulator with XRE-family HTH domain
MMNPSDFGIELRRLRISRGVSQEALANAIKVNPRHVSAIECGHKRALSPAHYRRVATFLSLSTKELEELHRARLTALLDHVFATELTREALSELKSYLRACPSSHLRSR